MRRLNFDVVIVVLLLVLMPPKLSKAKSSSSPKAIICGCLVCGFTNHIGGFDGIRPEHANHSWSLENNIPRSYGCIDCYNLYINQRASSTKADRSGCSTDCLTPDFRHSRLTKILDVPVERISESEKFVLNAPSPSPSVSSSSHISEIDLEHVSASSSSGEDSDASTSSEYESVTSGFASVSSSQVNNKNVSDSPSFKLKDRQLEKEKEKEKEKVVDKPIREFHVKRKTSDVNLYNNKKPRN